MAKIMKIIALLSTSVTVLFAVLYLHLHTGLLLTLGITFGTTAYHLIMRLLVGGFFDLLLHNHMNYRRKWFQVSAAEQRLYAWLKVKKWKAQMPTYDPSSFDSKLHSWEEIAQAMCQAELVHEVIILLSFLPILAAIAFGAVWVFVITSVLAACYDAIFVILQRYNRPRIIALIHKKDHK